MTITTPTEGSQAYGVITVEADVSDDTRIAGVEFYVDGILRERISAAQSERGQSLSVPGAKMLREVRNAAAAVPPDRILKTGNWQFDFNEAQAIFLSADKKVRKLDGNGRISAVIHPDVDIVYLQLLPQLNALAVAFSEPQALDDGKYYTLALADFKRGALIGLEAAPAWLVGNFATSPALQTDGLGNLYYLINNANQVPMMRIWNHDRGAAGLFDSDRPILEWQVGPDGAILLKRAPEAAGASPLAIWQPRLGWIGDNQSLLSASTIRQWRLGAVSRGGLRGNILEAYFPQSAEIYHGQFDAIRSVSLLDNVILIAGSQAGLDRVELLERDGNSGSTVPTGSLEVGETCWLSTGQALLAGYDRAGESYVLARLQWLPEEPPTIVALCALSGMPLQIQGAGFSADRETQASDSKAGAAERKELQSVTHDLVFKDPGVDFSNVSSRLTFVWDTMSYPVAPHSLRVVAYDDALASGSDEKSVIVVRVALELLVERRTVQAFSILRHYGQIQFLVEDFGLQMAQYRILRQKGSGDFELLKTVLPGELQNNQFQMQDKYLEEDTAYTYRVEAYDTTGQLVGISLEKTI